MTAVQTLGRCQRCEVDHLVAELLTERDARPLVDAVTSWDEATCVRVRAAFRSFGCCGVTDPIDDLRALGLLGDAA